MERDKPAAKAADTEKADNIEQLGNEPCNRLPIYWDEFDALPPELREIARYAVGGGSEGIASELSKMHFRQNLSIELIRLIVEDHDAKTQSLYEQKIGPCWQCPIG